jgi:hypothetical protein
LFGLVKNYGTNGIRTSTTDGSQQKMFEIPKEPISVECERMEFTVYQYFAKLQLLS